MKMFVRNRAVLIMSALLTVFALLASRESSSQQRRIGRFEKVIRDNKFRALLRISPYGLQHIYI